MQLLNPKNKKIIVFSDLDGTLLSSKYDLSKTHSYISRLIDLNVPVVFCSSKTRKEIEYYRNKLQITAPFVSENGAAIFVPKGCFNTAHNYNKHDQHYDIIQLGIDYPVVREKFKKAIGTCGCAAVGFSDLTAEQLASETGLSVELARLAKQREFSEPIRFTKEPTPEFYRLMQSEGLRVTFGGRYFLLSGNHTKGDAVLLLKKLFSEEFSSLATIGVGNDANDKEMLDAVDYPFFIQTLAMVSETWQKIVEIVLKLGSVV